MDESRPIVFLDLHEVTRRVGLRKSFIYRHIALGAFPAPVRLSSRCSRWNAAEVDQWMRDRLAERAA